MAQDKKSFLLYADQKGLFDQLPDDIAGKLIKHIFSYVNDESPESDDLVINIAFEPIKRQLKRDLKKWEGLKGDRSDAGKLGNLKRYYGDIYDRVKANKITLKEGLKLAKDRKAIQSDTKLAVTVTDTVTDNVTDNVKYNSTIKDCYVKCLQHFDTHLHPKNEKTKNNWLDTVDKLNRIDGIPFDKIEEIVSGIRGDDFWARNFLSILKLRKKDKEGVMYVVKFNEYLKSKKNGKQPRKQTRFERFQEAYREDN